MALLHLTHQIATEVLLLHCVATAGQSSSAYMILRQACSFPCAVGGQEHFFVSLLSLQEVMQCRMCLEWQLCVLPGTNVGEAESLIVARATSTPTAN
jgi:hypothetical protein